MDTAVFAEAVSQDVNTTDQPVQKQIPAKELYKDKVPDKPIDGGENHGDKGCGVSTDPGHAQNDLSCSASSTSSSEPHFSPPVQDGSHTTTATSFSSERQDKFGSLSPNDGSYALPSPTAAASQPSSTTTDSASLENSYTATKKTIYSPKKTGNFQRGPGFVVPKRGIKIKFPRKNAVSALIPPARPEKRVKAPIEVLPDVEPDVTLVWPSNFQPIPQPGNFRLRELKGLHSVKYITGGAWRKSYYENQEARIEAKAKGLAPPPNPPETDDNIYFDFPCGLGFHFAKNIETDTKRPVSYRRPLYANDFGSHYYDQREEFKPPTLEKWQRAHPVKPFLPLDPDLGRVSMPIRFRLTLDENPYERANLVLDRNEMILNDGDFTFI